MTGRPVRWCEPTVSPMSRRSPSRLPRGWGRNSVALVPLFLPWVSVHVVAVGLPESGSVLVHELQAPDPLSALPEIQVRYQQPGRATVLGLKRGVCEAEGHPRLAAGDIRQRKVGRVAAVG